MFDTLNRSTTLNNTICDVHEYMSKLNKYKTALVLLILNTALTNLELVAIWIHTLYTKNSNHLNVYCADLGNKKHLNTYWPEIK